MCMWYNRSLASLTRHRFEVWHGIVWHCVPCIQCFPATRQLIYGVNCICRAHSKWKTEAQRNTYIKEINGLQWTDADTYTYTYTYVYILYSYVCMHMSALF